MAIPHNSRLTAQAPLRRLRHGICVAKMLDNVGLRYPHRASGAKAPRTLRPLPLLRFAVSATGGAHLCSIQYYLRVWLGICRTSLAVSALRIMRYCLYYSIECSKMVLAYTKKYRFLAKNLILGCSLRQKKENEKGKNKQRYLGYIIFYVLNRHGQYVRITLIRSKEERKN